VNTIGSVNLANILIVKAHTDGGCTIDRMGNPAGDGFIVGGVCPSLVISGTSPIDPAERDQVAQFVAFGGGDHFGSWWDGTTGKIHIDVVSFIADRNAAIHLGRERGEIAIWDSAAGEEIRLADCDLSGFTAEDFDEPSDAVSEEGFDPYAGCYMPDSGDDDFFGHYDESGY
jgi:hypothetical protein